MSEAELWKRFRDAQDKFFAARTEVFAAKETELRSHAAVKEQLLAEAQALLPVTDLRTARTTLRSIQERWEQAGSVPRDSREQLESGLRRVEEAVRRAEENQWRKSNPEALARAEGTVNQLRAAITSLEAQLARARERGDQSADPQGRRSPRGPPLLARRSRAHPGGVQQLGPHWRSMAHRPPSPRGDGRVASATRVVSSRVGVSGGVPQRGSATVTLRRDVSCQRQPGACVTR